MNNDDFDKFFELHKHNKEPKDPKTSIRNKYKRRLVHFARTLDDFIYHAEQRLDTKQAGLIRNRAETEEFLERCKKLKEMIPIKDPLNEELTEEQERRFCDIFGIAYDKPGSSQTLVQGDNDGKPS